MTALVVYESMYGNTHRVAEAIAQGLDPTLPARAVPVGEVTDGELAACTLLVVGGPTHVHGMSRPSTRQSAANVASATGAADVEAQTNLGVREWLTSLRPDVPGRNAAAFDTRNHGPAFITGRASKGIAEGLRKAGYRLLSEPESFEVDPGPSIAPEELERATRWGAALGLLLSKQGP